MFKAEQIIYYIDADFKIMKGIFKGYVTITSSCPPIVNLFNFYIKEHVLINEDYVFLTFDEAKEFMDED